MIPKMLIKVLIQVSQIETDIFWLLQLEVAQMALPFGNGAGPIVQYEKAGRTISGGNFTIVNTAFFNPRVVSKIPMA